MSSFAHIRNFSIIAHIDHGKTTLTDAILRVTKTVSDLDLRERIMDSNPIEKQRGITIKLAPVRMEYTSSKTGQNYILNLIDTPGHVDFGYEVSRSLAACEGVLLLVDATQGIQAQTLSNFQKAKDLNLTIIPVLNKVDITGVDKEAVKLECMETFGVEESEIIEVSAKTGKNVPELLEVIIEKIAPPQEDEKNNPSKALRALIVTSHFDVHRGAIAMVRVVDGSLSKEKLKFMSSNAEFFPIEVGFFTPKMEKSEVLQAGEVGYVATGLKDIKHLKVGDTITTFHKSAEQALPGYREPTPMVYMELYPIDGDDFTLLQDAMAKLSLHDAALQFSGTHSPALGNGLRVGFLGILHAEIVRERLEKEFDLSLIATAPSVTYQVKTTAGNTVDAHTPAEMPDPSLIASISEPLARLSIFCPEKYMSPVIKLLQERRGQLVSTTYVGDRVQSEAVLPLAELITDFHDTLKSATAGFASMEYELSGYQEVDAVKVGILLNHELVEALSFITVREQAQQKGRELVDRLKEVIPRQQFEVPVQAAIGGQIIARETLKAYRKDVTAKLYGGDVTRRMKLLRKQAKGKKKLKQIGKVELNQEAFLAVLKR